MIRFNIFYDLFFLQKTPYHINFVYVDVDNGNNVGDIVVEMPK